MERKRRRKAGGILWRGGGGSGWGYFGASVSPSISSFSLLSCSLRQQLPFSFAQNRRRLMGKWKTEPGGKKNRGQTTVLLSVRPAAGALVYHMLPALGSARTKLLREGKKAPQDNLDPVLVLGGVSKEYLMVPNPSLLRSFGRLVGVRKFYTRLWCSWQDLATPKGFVSLGMEEFHPFEPRGRSGRGDGATQDAKRCHGASVPVLARGLLRRPHHGGASGAFSQLPLAIDRRTRRHSQPPRVSHWFWGAITHSPCFIRAGKLRHGQGLPGAAPGSARPAALAPRGSPNPWCPPLPGAPMGRAGPPVPGDTGGA